MREDLQPNLVETVVSDYEYDEEQKETSDNEEYSDDEDSEIETSENTLESFDEADQLIESEWKLSSGKLVKNVLSEKALNVFESCKNSKRLNAYQASVIRCDIMFLIDYCTHNRAKPLIYFLKYRLGFSSIVDLSSEFQDGMSTWFGSEWAGLKQKAQNQINMIPMKFEGCVLDSIMKIENVCKTACWLIILIFVY